MQSFLRYAARPLEILVGAIFLAAAALKAQNVSLFVAQIFQYHVFEALPLLKTVALVTLAIETFLGAALVLGLPNRKFTHGLVQFMLIFFAVLIAYAWAFQGLKDCGCFGKIHVTPAQGILKNIILCVMDGLAWYGLTRPGTPAPSPARTRASLAACGILALGFVACAWPQLDVKETPTASPSPGPGPRPPDPPKDDRPFAKYTVTSEAGETFNLASGVHLVAILSMTCDHCKASVPGLNELYRERANLPGLVALGFEPAPGDLDTFKLETHPEFPLQSMGGNFMELAPLIGREPPRLSLVKDGKSLHDWDWEDKPPTVDEVETYIKSNPVK